MSRGSVRGMPSGVLARRVAGPVVLVVALISSIAVGTSNAGADATPGPGTTVPASTSASTSAAPTGGPTSPSPSESASSGPSESASDTPTGTPTESPSDTPSESSSTSGGPVTGVPGLDSPGISMTVTPRPNGDLAVQQTVWLNQPTSTLQLAPPDLSAAGVAFATRAPTIVDLTLSTDSQDIPLESTEVSTPRPLSLLQPAARFTLTYTVRGAVVRSNPAPPGRALGALRPLLLAPDQPLPVTVDVLGGRAVRAIVCPELGGDLVINCAAPTSSGYRLSSPIPSAASLLQLQLDLNRA